jgi:hypothetical protein
MASRIQLRRGSSQDWTTTNPLLSEGEVGFEVDSGKFKIGNGSSLWSSLEYFGGEVDLSGYLTTSSASTTYLTQSTFSSFTTNNNLTIGASEYMTQGGVNRILSGTGSGISGQIVTDNYSSHSGYLAGSASAVATHTINIGYGSASGIDNTTTKTINIGSQLLTNSAVGNINIGTSTLSNGAISNINIGSSGSSTTFAGTVSIPGLNKNLDIIPAKTGAYTISSGDQNDLIQLNGTFTVSIPTDATFNFDIGTQISLLNIGTGVITIAATTPGTTTVNATPGLKLRAQWSSVTLIKRAANTWVVVGDLTA